MKHVNIAQHHNLILIEDSAQAIGAFYNGVSVGNFGTGVFSLYATKNITSAEGGMITTNDEKIMNVCQSLRNHGMLEKYVYDGLGFNYRISNVHAAIGNAQFQMLEQFRSRRTYNTNYLNSHLHGIATPTTDQHCIHAWNQYTVKLANEFHRSQIVKLLSTKGIGTGIYYPHPNYEYPHVRKVVGEIHCPVTENLCKSVLSLPIHPQVPQEALDVMVETLNSNTIPQVLL